jgi:hypothetical protein
MRIFYDHGINRRSRLVAKQRFSIPSCPSKQSYLLAKGVHVTRFLASYLAPKDSLVVHVTLTWTRSCAGLSTDAEGRY